MWKSWQEIPGGLCGLPGIVESEILEGKMTIKIEISGIGLREHVAKIIARQIVKTGIKEKQKWYNEEAIQCELNNMGTIKLVKCWIRNVWPLPQLHSLQSRLSHLH